MSGLPKVPARCCFTICAANKNIERKAPWWICRGSNPGIADCEPSPLAAEVQIHIAGLSRLSERTTFCSQLVLRSFGSLPPVAQPGLEPGTLQL